MGELRTRKRGKTWEYSFEAAKVEGKRKTISKGGFRTKTDAIAAGTQAKAEYDNIGQVFTASEISVKDYYDLWLKEYCSINVKETTYRNYEKKIRLYITPALGKYKLKSLSPAVLQAFINELFNNGFSRNTLSVVKGILTGSLNYAIEPLALIQTNPMIGVKLPSVRAKAKTETNKKEREIVTEDQMKIILERFPIFHSCHLPLQLAYRCGMRLGEVFALTWDDINLENGTININKQVQNLGDSWFFSNPKYDSSRTIKIDNSLIKILELYKERQYKSKCLYEEYYKQLYVDNERRINTDKNGQEIHLINIRDNGSYIQPRVMQHCSRVIHYQLGFEKFDFHSLRHTHTTMLLEAGANPKDVQHRLGHKNINVTMQIYTHVTEKMQDNTIKILDSIFK